MPYPAALGQRPLEVREAYQALAQYAADYGREPLLLMMHAALPETLRPDLLNLIRANFVPGRGADLSLEADVLFSPLTTAIGGGYYRIDAQVRWHCLALLRSLYRDDLRPRARRVAELLWHYVASMEQRASRAADPQLTEFLDIQRWVALAFLEPASAAHAFADALRQAGDAPAAALLRLGGLTSAIEMPLANEQQLLAYARGMEALSSGDDERATSILEALGDGEIRVGGVVLKAPTALLAQRRQAPAGAEPADAEQQAPRRRTCVVIIGIGNKTDFTAGRVLDLDRSYEMIREAVAGLDMDCLRAAELTSTAGSPAATYAQLLDADLVVCELSADDAGVSYLLGVCWALRPSGTLVVADQDCRFSAALDLPPLLRYQQRNGHIDADERQRFIEQMRVTADDAGERMLGSPVYRHADLLPPRRKGPDTPAAESTVIDTGTPETGNDLCLVVQGFGRRPDRSGRTIDLDAAYAIILQAVEAAGLKCVRVDDFPGSGSNATTALYSNLHEAGLVIADLSTDVREVLLELGIRFGLRPGRTLLVAEEQWRAPHHLDLLRVLRYRQTGDELGEREASAFRSELVGRIKGALASSEIDSPVYLALPTLLPAARMMDPDREDPATEAGAAATPAQPPVAKVFISCAGDYQRYLRPLAEALARAGVEVNRDMDLKVGDPTADQQWGQLAAATMGSANAVIAVVGSRSRDSSWAMTEIEHANSLGKLLIPVVVDPFDEPRKLAALACANRDEQGRVLYLANLHDADLDAAIARTATNIRQALDARPAEGPQLRVITIREHGRSELQYIWAEETRHDRRVSFRREMIDRLLRELLDSTAANTPLVATLASMLLPPELVALPSAHSYHLVVAGEAAALPWELILAYQQDGLRAPVPVLRQLDGMHRPPGPANASRDALLIGNPRTGATLSDEGGTESAPPPGAREELARLARTLKSARLDSVISYGEDAKLVIDRLFSRAYRILLISGRAVREHRLPNKQMVTGFVLSDGVFLTAREIEAMRIIPEVIVLNGHQAGHPGLTGEMVPQLLKAGVRCVLAPAWTVDERVSAAFLQRLFIALTDGERFEDACANARRTAFEAAPELSTWAAYQAWGDADFTLPPQPPPA
ncbi:CHAT domain-containing protein [Accumulibacter sp.]|uniref:CHAT domain-containing protein n=1 Tax=Accumulibacter sp. TaxID=2053492 RepID=UPI002607CA73|nr:CHAT domain-containing protein [Accumulibacter sp.]